MCVSASTKDSVETPTSRGPRQTDDKGPLPAAFMSVPVELMRFLASIAMPSAQEESGEPSPDDQTWVRSDDMEFRKVSSDNLKSLRGLSLPSLELLMADYSFNWTLLEMIEEAAVLLGGPRLQRAFSRALVGERRKRSWLSIVSRDQEYGLLKVEEVQELSWLCKNFTPPRAVAVALWPFRIALPLGECELQLHSSSTVQSVEMGSTKLQSAEDMASILWTPEDIARRVTELGGAISRDFSGQSIAVVGVATGAYMFVADLVRRISLPMMVDFIRVSSYGKEMESSGVATICTDIKMDVTGKHVLIVEDIIDTGITLSKLVNYFTAKGSASVSVCVLLDKEARRKVPLKLGAGGKLYTGFKCPDSFVVGYGLDYIDHYRGLPYIGVLKPEVYEKSH